MDDLIQEFLVESNENLDRLDSELVKLESDPMSAELLASIFRSIHSIKGACGFLGFNKLHTLAHAGESSAGGIPASVGRTSVPFSAPLTAHATGRPTSPYSSPRTDGCRAPRPADSSSRPDRSWPDRRQRHRPLGRLRKLPNVCEGHSTSRRCWGRLWKGATRRRWTGVICHPKNNVSSTCILTDIFGGNHRDAFGFRRSDARTVDSGAEPAPVHAIHPCMNVGPLFGQHASTFFLIEKYYGATRESFQASRICSRASITFSKCLRIAFAKFFKLSAVKKNQETETLVLQE